MSENESKDERARDLEHERFALEQQRFEFEKHSQTRQQELQRLQIHQSRWDTFWRFFGSAVITGGIAAAVTMHGNKVQQQTTFRALEAEKAATARAAARASIDKERAAEDRKSEVLVQLLNAREAADSSLRARMFEALLQNYFKEPDEAAKVTILEMIGLNFRDSVQVKPMFELLDAELRSKKIDRGALRDASKTIIADQLKEIRHARDGGVCSYEIAKDSRIEPRCFPELSVMLTEIADDQSEVRVRTNSKDGNLLDKAEIGKGDEFSVSYFDMPMTDYTIVAAGHQSWRYSIVLREIDPDANKAKIAIAMLPVDSYSTQQEYKFDETIAEFLNPVERNRISLEPK